MMIAKEAKMETLILRARTMLRWLRADEVARQLIDTGVNQVDAVLAVQAAMTWEALPVRVDLELSREQVEQLRDQLNRALNAEEES